jgi:hypothetical protein
VLADKVGTSKFSGIGGPLLLVQFGSGYIADSLFVRFELKLVQPLLKRND